MRNLHIDKEIFKESKVKLAYLFGSYAKGLPKTNSDVDIAVLFKGKLCEPLALNEIAFLLRKLRGLFSAKLDIVNLDNASLLLKYEVVSSGKILYCESELERINFEVSVVKEYIDQKSLRRLYSQALYRKILQRA